MAAAKMTTGRGLIFVVEEDRPKAVKDAREVVKELARYDVHLKMLFTQSANDMLAKIEEHYKDVGGCESIWLVLSAHGRDNVICGTDDERSLGDFITTLTESCKLNPDIEDKPVYFIVQSCRGERYPEKVEVVEKVLEKVEEEQPASSLEEMEVDEDEDAGSSDSDTPEEEESSFPGGVNIYSNQCLLYSTTPGNYSFRRALFKAMVKLLKEGLEPDCGVEAFFTHVIGKVAEEFESKKERKVCPQYYSMLLADVALKCSHS